MKEKNSVTPQYTEGSLPERFDSFISHILKNITVSVMRKYIRDLKRANEVFVDDLDEYLTYDPLSGEDNEAVRLGDTILLIDDEKLIEGIRNLSPRKKQVLEGTVLLGIPVSILADELDLDEQTVSNYKYEGLRVLKRRMGVLEDE